ncbi:HupE/UreJ family protein [Ferruginibacter albus]|uniref:HupE/UreJ family protein n=1 Tax=Ferruginibacter albus TaxID=2875540 RepID=UPI001CC76C00|nr:HupE/UreJ family protein [Ferruginibacter albus]UAY50904.1 HupE/UreJ family protein [Ferruginibacter albus]
MKTTVRLKYTFLLLIPLLLALPVTAHFVLPQTLPQNPKASFYFSEGFRHVIFGNYSHLVLFLSLFLVSTEPRQFLLQWFIFFAADLVALSFLLFNMDIFSMTILLSPILAFASAFIAVQNIESKKIKPARYPILIIVALLHSFAFGSQIHEQQLAWQKKAMAIFSLNAGVSVAELAFLIVLYFTIGRFLSNKPFYYTKIVKPLSVAIILAAVWFMYAAAYLQ